jgi:hypothetical protein
MLGRGADADGVAERDLVAAHLQQRRRHVGHRLRRDRPLVGATHHAGDVAAHPHAGRVRRLGDRAEAFERLGDRAVDVLLAEGLGGGAEHRDLPCPGRQRGLEALEVGGEHRIGDAGRRSGEHARQQLGVVAHLRHPLGRHEGRGLDRLQPGALEAAHELELGVGGDELLLVLQAVARPHLDDADGGGKDGIRHGGGLLKKRSIGLQEQRSTVLADAATPTRTREHDRPAIRRSSPRRARALPSSSGGSGTSGSCRSPSSGSCRRSGCSAGSCSGRSGPCNTRAPRPR